VRVWGFERLPVRPPRASSPMLAQPERERSLSLLKRAVAARDYQEIVTFGFVSSNLQSRLGDEAGIRLLNPIAAQMDVMRTTLWAGLIDILQSNLNRKASRVRLFEVGRVFHADASVPSGPLTVKGVHQPLRLAALAYGPVADEQWGMPSRLVDYFDVKGDLEALCGAMSGELRFERAAHPALHPGRSARIVLAGQPVGWLGTLHPALQQHLELAHEAVVLELELDALRFRELARPGENSRFPPVQRDIAWVVPSDLSAQSVREEIDRALAAQPLGGLVTNVRLFDEYRGKGLENKEKSLAFRFWMQDTQRTLNDAEVAQLMDGIVSWMGERLGVRLRSGA